MQGVPKSPNCTVCVFNNECAALQTGRVGELPVKLKKTKVANRYFNYLIIKDRNGNTIVEKSTHKGIWHNLYQFPLLETDTELPAEDAVGLIRSYRGLGFEPDAVTLLHPAQIVHKLSHQHLHIRFWELHTYKILQTAISPQQAKALPFPIVIYKFIENLWV